MSCQQHFLTPTLGQLPAASSTCPLPLTNGQELSIAQLTKKKITSKNITGDEVVAFLQQTLAQRQLTPREFEDLISVLVTAPFLGYQPELEKLGKALAFFCPVTLRWRQQLQLMLKNTEQPNQRFLLLNMLVYLSPKEELKTIFQQEFQWAGYGGEWERRLKNLFQKTLWSLFNRVEKVDFLNFLAQYQQTIFEELLSEYGYLWLELNEKSHQIGRNLAKGLPEYFEGVWELQEGKAHSYPRGIVNSIGLQQGLVAFLGQGGHLAELAWSPSDLVTTLLAIEQHDFWSLCEDGRCLTHCQEELKKTENAVYLSALQESLLAKPAEITANQVKHFLLPFSFSEQQKENLLKNQSPLLNLYGETIFYLWQMKSQSSQEDLKQDLIDNIMRVNQGMLFPARRYHLEFVAKFPELAELYFLAWRFRPLTQRPDFLEMLTLAAQTDHPIAWELVDQTPFNFYQKPWSGFLETIRHSSQAVEILLTNLEKSPNSPLGEGLFRGENQPIAQSFLSPELFFPSLSQNQRGLQLGLRQSRLILESGKLLTQLATIDDWSQIRDTLLNLPEKMFWTGVLSEIKRKLIVKD